MKINEVLLVLTLCYGLWISRIHAIWLNLPSTGIKCVSEEIHNNVVVLGDYVVVSDDPSHSPTISIKVTSPYANVLHLRDNVTYGQFAFTTHEAGSYLACFWAGSIPNQGTGDVNVNLEWKTGVAAKDWETVAKREKLEVIALKICVGSSSTSQLPPQMGVELELRKLEGAVEAIHENLLYLKSRDADMRTVSESTNFRVAWFSILSMGVGIAVSAFQVWHLTQFFQKKKLI